MSLYDLSNPKLRRGRNPIDGPSSPYDCSVSAEERKQEMLAQILREQLRRARVIRLPKSRDDYAR